MIRFSPSHSIQQRCKSQSKKKLVFINLFDKNFSKNNKIFNKNSFKLLKLHRKYVATNNKENLLKYNTVVSEFKLQSL